MKITTLLFALIIAGCGASGGSNNSSKNDKGNTVEISYDLNLDIAEYQAGEIGTYITGTVILDEPAIETSAVSAGLWIHGTGYVARGTISKGKTQFTFKIKNLMPGSSYRIRAWHDMNNDGSSDSDFNDGDSSGYWEGEGNAYWDVTNFGGVEYFLDYRGGDKPPYVIIRIHPYITPVPG